jgi:ATP-dependent Clp protease ATP-binding subunit ClpA
MSSDEIKHTKAEEAPPALLSSEELAAYRKELASDDASLDIRAKWEGYLDGLESFLRSRLRGQDLALQTLAGAVRRVESLGLRSDRKPKGTFFFVGPTGVGKTESTKLTAQYLYGSDKDFRAGGNFAIFDMGEYGDEGSIKQLLGRDKSEQGVLGDAIDALNARGGGIILFDEIEKAHIAVSKMMLGLIDDGRVRMMNDSVKRANEMYLVFTSNVGAKTAAEFKRPIVTTVRRIMIRAAEQHFGPEFVARFGATVVFMRLEREIQVDICRDFMPSVCRRIQEFRGYRAFDYDEDALQALASLAYSMAAGARYVKSTLEREVGDAVLAAKDTFKFSHPSLLLTTDARTRKLIVREQ